MTGKRAEMDFLCELKADDEEEGVFEGLASTFGGQPDSFGDVVARGAFKATLAEHKAAGTMPLMLWQHDTRSPIGRWLDMRESTRGLVVRGKLTLEVQRAREAHALLRDEALNGLSIGFRTRKADDSRNGVRRLTDVDLLEVSLVSMPANGRARVTAVKAEHIHTIREFEAAVRDELGFSARAAKALAAGGWPALGDRDDRDVGLKRVSDELKRVGAQASTIIAR